MIGEKKQAQKNMKQVAYLLKYNCSHPFKWVFFSLYLHGLSPVPVKKLTP